MFSKFILTLKSVLVLVTFISSSTIFADDWEGFSPKYEADINTMDLLDEYVMQMESLRLLSLLSSGMVIVEDQVYPFYSIFFATFTPIVNSQATVDFSVVERYLRKWNTGMTLVAIPLEKAKPYFPDNNINCVISFVDNKPADLKHVIYLKGRSPAEGKAMIEELGLTEEQNLINLKNSGFAEECTST